MSLGNFIRINPIEQCEHIHIWNAIILLSKAMNSKKNWNHSSKYLLAMAFASVLLSTFGIFTYNAFAEDISIRADGQKMPSNHLGNTISSVQPSSNVKHVNDQTNTNHKAKHIKSPPHIPPSILLDEFIQSKLCKCISTKHS